MGQLGAWFISRVIRVDEDGDNHHVYLHKNGQESPSCYLGPSLISDKFIIDCPESGWYATLELAIEACKKVGAEYEVIS